MKSPALFVGDFLVKILFAFVFCFSAFAHAETFDATDLNQPEPTAVYDHESHLKKYLLFGAAEVATIYLVSQTQNGPIIFGGIYAAGALFTMRETFYAHDEDPVDLFVPIGMLTMSVLNFALLNNDSRYTYNDVFFYNLGGAAILNAYALWDNSQRRSDGHRKSYSFLPFVRESHTGFAWQLRY
jgi:hypothetical protein